MAEEQRSRRGRRPPRMTEEPVDGPSTDEELPAAESFDDDTDEGLDSPEAPGSGLQEVRDGNVIDLSDSSDESFVFDGGGSDAAVDASSTFVGDMQADAPAAEPVGDKTEILPVAQETQEDYPVLTIETADGGTSDVEVVKDRFVLGRSPDCDVVIPDSLISRHHAVIERRDDGWYLVDQNSGNGSFLNNERIRDELLYDGDLIQLGEAVITFSASGPAAEQAPRLDATRMLPAASGAADGTGVITAGAVGLGLGKRKKLLLIATAAVGLLIVVGLILKMSKPPPPPPGPSPQQLAAAQRQKAMDEARQKFDKVKVLVKQEKWTEALPLIGEVAQVISEDDNVKEYAQSIEREANAQRALEQARKLMEESDFEGAKGALARVDSESMQQGAAEELKKTLDERIVEKSLSQANEALQSKDWDLAIALADELLRKFPDNTVAKDVKVTAEKGKAAEAVRKPKPARKPPKKPPRPRTLLVGKALELYRGKQIDRALAQASASGVSADGVKKLKSFQTILRQGISHAKNPGQSARAIKYLLKAVELDKKLGGAKGVISEKLHKTLAKVYFLQGVDAHTRRKYPLAYASFIGALRFNPGLSQAKKRLRDLELEAKKLFETAYVIKSQSPDKAVKHCQTVLKMVDKKNPYYAKCKKMIQSIRGAD